MEFLEESPVVKTPVESAEGTYFSFLFPEVPLVTSASAPSPLGIRSPKPPHGGKTVPYTAYIVRKFCLRNLESKEAKKKKSGGSSKSKPSNSEATTKKVKNLETKTTLAKASKSETDADEVPNSKSRTKNETRKQNKNPGARDVDTGKDKEKERKRSEDDEPNENKRIIYHYHYCSWPDMDVPNNGTDLLEMMQDAEKTQAEQMKQYRAHSSKKGSGSDEESPPFPTVVHCSAGIGMTNELFHRNHTNKVEQEPTS